MPTCPEHHEMNAVDGRRCPFFLDFFGAYLARPALDALRSVFDPVDCDSQLKSITGLQMCIED